MDPWLAYCSIGFLREEGEEKFFEMMESGAPVCHTCGEHVGLNTNGEAFVACHECNFPTCKTCFEYEIKEGRKVCLRCGNPYDGMLLSFLDSTSFSFQVHFYLVLDKSL